jgi:hypothetical protein
MLLASACAGQHRIDQMTDNELAEVIAPLTAAEVGTPDGFRANITLAEALANEPEFARPPRVLGTARHAHTFNVEFAAQQMLAVARTTREPMSAVRWLRRVSSETQATGGAVKALYGVNCAGRIPLSETVVLMPFTDLPPSTTREWIIEEHDRINARPGFRGIIMPPQAALYRAGLVAPLFLDQSDDLGALPRSAWFDELDEAALLLALTPGTIPLEAAHWLHYDDPDIDRVGRSGISRYLSEFQPSRLVGPLEITAESVAGLLPRYRGLLVIDRDRLKLSLDRLIRSRCPLNPANRAIDLAIALEVLFMNQDSGEHSYKISLRAARLINDVVADRRVVFSEVKKVYDLRSAMVHTGRGKDWFTVNGVRRTAHDLVEAVDVVCTQAMRQILARGAIPDDWHDVELG